VTLASVAFEWRTHVVQRFFEREKKIVPNLGRDGATRVVQSEHPNDTEYSPREETPGQNHPDK